MSRSTRVAAGETRPHRTLERFLSKTGTGSRTDAKGWILAGRVEVNGRVVRNPQQWIDMTRDRVCVDGKPLTQAAPVYLLLHKPKGYVTTRRDPEGRPTVYDLIRDVDAFVSPVGRLDLDTSGLLLITNDTQLADQVSDPRSHVEKTYLVKASPRLSDDQLQTLRDGVEVLEVLTRPARVVRRRDSGNSTIFEITLTEGRNRQVRRMVRTLGAKVLKLVRIQIGSIAIGTLGSGEWRPLTQAEVKALRSASHVQPATGRGRATRRKGAVTNRAP